MKPLDAFPPPVTNEPPPLTPIFPTLGQGGPAGPGNALERAGERAAPGGRRSREAPPDGYESPSAGRRSREVPPADYESPSSSRRSREMPPDGDS